MPGLPESETLYEYRGRRYPYHSGGDGFVRIGVNNTPTRDEFPDALELHDDPREPWVTLPLSAPSACYSQDVTGMWHGVPVTVDGRVRRGLRRGMVIVRYAGADPDAALAAGLSGNQNDGWSALVQPDEVEDVHVETTRHPMAGEISDCREDITRPPQSLQASPAPESDRVR